MTQPSSPETQEPTLAQQLARLILSLRKLPYAANQVEALHHQQLHSLFVLSHLLREGQTVRPSDLSRAMFITRGAVTHMLNTLQAAGLIEREVDPSDRRNVLLTITPAGLERMEKQRAFFLARVQGVVDFLGEEDARELTRILARAAPYLRSQSQKPNPQ